jgi:hypothetical protein
VSFATGGYARGLRSEELMKKMTNGTGMLTKDEWIAFHEKIFVMLDKKKTGVVDAEEFISASGGDDVVTIATGGYARWSSDQRNDGQDRHGSRWNHLAS